MTDETPSEILYLSYCYILERRRSASLCDTYVWGGGRTFLLWPKLLCLRFFYARSEEEPEHPFPQFCVLYEASRKVLSASFSNLRPRTYQQRLTSFCLMMLAAKARLSVGGRRVCACKRVGIGRIACGYPRAAL